MKRLTTKEFIRRAIDIHGDRYSYDLVDYKSMNENVEIICLQHGPFLQRPDNHLCGKGCLYCCGKKRLKKDLSHLNLSKGVKAVQLNNDKYAIVDEEDYERVSKYNWYYNRGYARNSTVGALHRFVMRTPPGMVTDHINHDTLDNRKSNLRVCPQSKNAKNCSAHRDGSSVYKGVSWSKKHSKWKAQIRRYGKNTHLGLFESEEDAATAYDKEAKKVFGEFAYLNFPHLNDSSTVKFQHYQV